MSIENSGLKEAIYMFSERYAYTFLNGPEYK